MADVHTGAPAPGSPPVEGEHVLAAPWPVEEDRSAGDVAPVTGGRQAAGGVPGLADREAAAGGPADDAVVGPDLPGASGTPGNPGAPADIHLGRLTGPGDAAIGAGALGDTPGAAPVDPEAYASARVVVARVLGLTGARSVVDVGCGSGGWTKACRDLGVPEVVGIDGPGMAADRTVATELVEHDLARPLGLDRRFSLAICVDVGDRLAPDRAPGLVADLTALAPVVLFSAAVPGQSRTPHANDRWAEYWVALFEAHGWTCRDAIRPWIRTNEDVAWWHRQNVYLAVAPTAAAAYTSFPQLAAVRPRHPVDYVLRPPGDVMTVPLPPPPPPPPPPPAPVLPEAEADALPGVVTGEQAPEPPAGVVPESPDAADGRPMTFDGATAPASRGSPAAHEAPARGTDEDLLFPEPPGWSTIRRLAGRVRRRDRR